MPKNMGGIDRIIRAVVGVAAICAGVYLKSWWGAIGVVLLATSAVGICPAYLPFGISTGGQKPPARG